MAIGKYERHERSSKTHEIGNMFLDNYKFATLEDTREIYYYDESKGVYIPAKVMIEETARTQADEDISKHEMNEIFYYIETNKTIVKRSEFDADPYVVNVKNGLLDLRTGKLGPHRSDYLSLVQIPVEYDPKAACPNIAKFLKNVQDKEGIFKILKLLGYVLMKSAKYQKAFLFVGSGANGKGTLINLIEKFVGEDNTSSQAMQALSKRFAAAELFGKMVNACADLPKEAIDDSGMFKMLVAGDSVTAERKNQDPFKFRNYAKLIFSTNQIPETKDETYAFYRRLIIIPFRKTFQGSNDDPHLIDKMTTPEELSGLLNIALAGARKLSEDNGFDEENVHKIKAMYESNASLIQDFITECCVIDIANKDCYIETNRLQQAYNEYCKTQGSISLDDNILGEAVKKIGIEHAKKQIKGNRRYYYIGIRLKIDTVQSGLVSR